MVKLCSLEYKISQQNLSLLLHLHFVISHHKSNFNLHCILHSGHCGQFIIWIFQAANFNYINMWQTYILLCSGEASGHACHAGHE